jgi:hypothetical protein
VSIPLLALAIVIASLALAASLRATQRRTRDAKIQSVATGIETLRRLSTRETRRRRPGPADELAGEQLAVYEANTREMEAAGLTLLGDRIEEQEDGSPYGTSRWFVDATGTICGWFGALPVKKAPGTFRTLMLFFSESESGQFLTTSRGAPEIGIARPPTLHRQFVAWTEGIPATLERHRSLIQSAAAGSTLRRVATLDDVLELLARHRRHIADWRAGQPGDALLEADARNILRERYGELGPQVLEYMRR